MKKVKYFLSSIIIGSLYVFSGFTEIPPYEYLDLYYSNGTIEKEAVSAKIQEFKIDYEKDKSAKNFEEFLKFLYVYSLYATMEESIQNEFEKYDKFLNKNIRKHLYVPEVLSAYIDYIWSAAAWKKNKFSMINSYPSFCRNLANKTEYKAPAMGKFAMWYVYATNKNMSNWNAFIKNQEKYIESLNSVEKYNAYLHYSIFYMKIGCHSQGFEYIKKAEELYPENLMTYILQENYKKGVFGW